MYMSAPRDCVLSQGGTKLAPQPSIALGAAAPDLATAARVLADQTQFITTSDGVQLVSILSVVTMVVPLPHEPHKTYRALTIIWCGAGV